MTNSRPNEACPSEIIMKTSQAIIGINNVNVTTPFRSDPVLPFTRVPELSAEMRPNNIGPYRSKALNHRHMNGPTIHPRAPFLASNTVVFFDRIAAFASVGVSSEVISKRCPKGWNVKCSSYSPSAGHESDMASLCPQWRRVRTVRFYQAAAGANPSSASVAAWPHLSRGGIGRVRQSKSGEKLEMARPSGMRPFPPPWL